MATEFTYGRDHSYTYEEKGYFNSTACERDDPWLSLKYTGEWTGRGLSASGNHSLVSVQINSVWLKLIHEEVCVRDMTDGSIDCFDTLAAVRQLCPCNGWDWGQWKTTKSKKFQPRERNIGMFCRPQEQCPLMHELYLEQTQYRSYRATAREACFSKESTSQLVGWEQPEEDSLREVRYLSRAAAMFAWSMGRDAPSRMVATGRDHPPSVRLQVLGLCGCTASKAGCAFLPF